MEKTVKIRAYSEDAKSHVAQGNPADERSLELAMKDAQIEEEKSRSLEHLKTIVQLRENLKLEQAKTVEMAKKAAGLELRVNESASQEANELAKKNAQLEEEKSKSQEQLRMIVQLRESLKQEQAKTAELADKVSGLEANAKATSALEAKVKELTDVLGKIVSIAAAGKAD
jgi:chromosome segregation ATPase